jgi:SAM-dependent methyltransferase
LTLDDPAVVRAEYSTERRLLQRRLDFWGIFEGSDPQELELAALVELHPRRVLDAGCGPGEFSERIVRKLGVDLVGIDQSERFVEVARARGVDARVGDLLKLPFEDGEFDAVVANWVLYHLPDLGGGIVELARVLRPGGRLAAITNGERHLEEIWGPDYELAFRSENGAALLAGAFARVKRLDVEGSVVFATLEALQGYVEAFSVLGTRPLPLADRSFPLRATCRNSIFIADKA